MPPAFLTSQPDANSLRVSCKVVLAMWRASEELLTEVATRDPQLQAFAWLEPEHIRQQAQRLDAQFVRSGPVGPAHGLPLALKDIIDTAGIPTENGTALDSGRIPTRQAAVVERWLAAGGVLLARRSPQSWLSCAQPKPPIHMVRTSLLGVLRLVRQQQ